MEQNQTDMFRHPKSDDTQRERRMMEKRSLSTPIFVQEKNENPGQVQSSRKPSLPFCYLPFLLFF